MTPKTDAKPKFLAALEKVPNVARACKLAGISRETAYRYRADDPEFAEAWQAAIEAAIDALEQTAFERARKGESDTLTIFLLKCHRPERYRETAKVEHAGQVGISLDVVLNSLPAGIREAVGGELAAAVRERGSNGVGHS